MSTPLFPTSPLAQSTAQFLIQSRNVLVGVQSLLVTGTRLVWNNPLGYTPQQVCDALGPAAAGVFQCATDLCALVGDATGTVPNPVPSWATVTPNADGTVTITGTPPSASSNQSSNQSS